MSSYLQGKGIHVDKHLTQIALNYSQDGGFIAPELAPIINVAKQTDMYKTYNQGDLWRREATERSPGSEPNKISLQVGSGTYAAKNYALAADVTIEDRANADESFIMDLEEGRTRLATQKLMLDWEVRLALQCTSTSNVGTSSTVASAWTAYTNSNPLQNIWTQMDNIHAATGFYPNRICFGINAWKHFARHDKVIDKIQKTGVAGGGLPVTVEQATQLLQVDKILVGKAFYNTAQEGQNATIGAIWADHVLVYYAPMTASRDVPSFMYSFRWTAPGLANFDAERIPYDQKRKVDEVHVGYYQDERIVSSAFAALITNVTSAQ